MKPIFQLLSNINTFVLLNFVKIDVRVIEKAIWVVFILYLDIIYRRYIIDKITLIKKINCKMDM